MNTAIGTELDRPSGSRTQRTRLAPFAGEVVAAHHAVTLDEPLAAPGLDGHGIAMLLAVGRRRREARVDV